MARALRLATRGSPLALAQVEIVRRLVAARGGTEVSIEPVVVQSRGDKSPDRPIHSFGGQGIFVAEVEAAVLEGRADAAVHSAKDLPASIASGLEISVVPERADRRDALVGAALRDLGPGARIATGSVRRRAQLAWLRPDLAFEELRGNLGTRIAKVPAGGAVVVAAAALWRLGWGGRAAQVLSIAEMLPQVGQGAIAVCSRPGDGEVAELLAPIDDDAAHRCLLAERAFLAGVGGGCDRPVGASAELTGDGSLVVEGLVASEDGHVLVRSSLTGEAAHPDALGRSLAEEILDRRGGRALLALADSEAPGGRS
ncbi:MAG: hydroxymethylbilane synthase [Acidimicrobiales bacterium]